MRAPEPPPSSSGRVLREHVRAHHRKLNPRSPLERLARAHAGDHHRYGSALDHFHAGVNLGPAQRPDGWRTGADVVLKERPWVPGHGLADRATRE